MLLSFRSAHNYVSVTVLIGGTHHVSVAAALRLSNGFVLVFIVFECVCVCVCIRLEVRNSFLTYEVHV